MSDSDEVLLKRLSSESVRERCWATTFAESVEDRVDEVALALLDVLERCPPASGSSAEETLGFARAITSLASILDRVSDSQFLAVRNKAIHLVESLLLIDDTEIRYHAKYALNLMRNAKKKSAD